MAVVFAYAVYPVLLAVAARLFGTTSRATDRRRRQICRR